MNYGIGVEKAIKRIAEQKELARIDAEAEGENPVCGDFLNIKIMIENEKVVGMNWKAEGCPPLLAAAQILFENVIETKLENFNTITFDKILSELQELPKTSYHAVELVVSLWCQALHKLQN